MMKEKLNSEMDKTTVEKQRDLDGVVVKVWSAVELQKLTANLSAELERMNAFDIAMTQAAVAHGLHLDEVKEAVKVRDQLWIDTDKNIASVSGAARFPHFSSAVRAALQTFNVMPAGSWDRHLKHIVFRDDNAALFSDWQKVGNDMLAAKATIEQLDLNAEVQG